MPKFNALCGDHLRPRNHKATMSNTPGNPSAGGDASDTMLLVQAIGQSLNMGTLYGVDHKVTRASLEGSYALLASFLEVHAHLDVNVDDTGLLINGSLSAAPLAGTVANRLSAHKLLSLQISKEFSLAEHLALFSILLTPPAKMNGTALDKLSKTSEFAHIVTQTVEYRRVSGGEPGPSGAEPASAPPVENPLPPPDLDNILAFLKDDTSANASRSAEDIRHLAGDAEKLADLILRTVEVRAMATDLSSGESLTDIVVGAIGKIVKELTTSAAVHTEKGRKQAKRSIMLLEKVVLQKLRQIADNETADAAAALLDEAAEGLDMDAMAAKFIKNRKAADEAGEKLRNIIARAEAPEHLSALHDTLVSQGLSEAGWQNLVVSRERSDGEEKGGSGVDDIKTLTLLLARLGETIDQAPVMSDPDPVRSLAGAARRRMESSAEKAEKKIAALQHALGKSGDAEGVELTRRELLELLAEIGQELSQPLTVVTTTIDMLKARRAGVLTEAQVDLLAMAADSSAHLAHLVDCLIKIAGHPESIHPDHAILGALYAGNPVK
jgi:hypothetical protein